MLKLVLIEKLTAAYSENAGWAPQEFTDVERKLIDAAAEIAASWAVPYAFFDSLAGAANDVSEALYDQEV